MIKLIQPPEISWTRFEIRSRILEFLLHQIPFGLALSLISLVLSGCAASRKSTVEAWRPPVDYTAVDRFELIRNAADQEALYTLAGGIKPMSSGIWRGSFEIDNPDLTEIRDVRQALGHLCNDVWYADVQVFEDTDDDDERQAQAFVVHREAFGRMIERHEAYWSSLGITPCTHPAEVVAIVDRLQRADRWRGYGYLFGYPDDAVDFFVQAGLLMDDGRGVGPGKDREFIQIPTHAADSGRFTYAVPLGHEPTPADRSLAQRARLILAAYEKRRSRMQDLDDLVQMLLELNKKFEKLSVTEL